MKERRLVVEPNAPEEEPQMLMTSMVDVIFILLAFFVCVTELKRGHLAVDVPEVPQADQPTVDTSSTPPLVVEVTGDDKVFVDGKEARDDAEMAALLAEATAKAGPEATTVHLSGDRQARNGTMMRVVSQLSKAGLKKIEFAVETGG